MIGRELMTSIAFSAPTVCALVCMVMVLLDTYVHRWNPHERHLRLFLALTYFVTLLSWLGLVLYIAYPQVFIYYHPVFLLMLMLDQVMFSRFVSEITDTGESRRFSRLHWIIPLFITAFSVLDYVLVPAGHTMRVAYGTDIPTYGTGFNLMYITTTMAVVVYNTFYPLLNLRNIRRYRRFVVDYSSDVQRTSLSWLAAMQALILGSVPVPLAGLLLGLPTFSTSGFVWLGPLSMFVFYVILCYNMLRDNYLIIRSETVEVKVPATGIASIGRKRFERYLREKKPYLNPKLRITDLAAGLNTNRSYLSAFINREYDMNFCRLINKCRLHELDRLRLANADKTNMELVLMAGFSEYRNYLRVKSDEDKLAVLKAFER